MVYHGQASDDGLVLSAWPVECPRNWTARVNAKLGEAQLESLRACVDRGRPLGQRAVGCGDSAAVGA